jgi:hypothetical protein
MNELTNSEIYDLLATRREIAVIWCIEDVQSVRPDLSEDQCWEVLQLVERHHDANIGICWTTLEIVADMLFGNASITDGKANDD